MTRLCTTLFVGGTMAALLSGCQVQKSANPLSPQLAGPIAGVEISTPALLEPGQDWEMRTRDQPIKLLFQNSNTNGDRPLTYSFELATDSAFKSVVFARTGVKPDDGPETRFQLPDKLAAGTYWWRTRAEDGANSSQYSSVKSFVVMADVILAPPTLASPISGTTVDDITPAFRLKAGDRSGVTAPLEYIVQVSNNSSFTSIAATFIQPETWPETRIDNGYAFLHDRTYYWRARTWHTADGGELSNWTATQTFRTPKPPVAPPSPPPPSGGGDPPGGGDVSKCNSSKGSDIAECIEGRYPQYRRAGVSLDQRKKDMQFLRDRLIEHALCRGLQVGQNYKRGNLHDISNDFITYYTGGRWVGVDIASGYDDTSEPLNMMWYQHGASTNWGYPYHKPYPYTCPN